MSEETLPSMKTAFAVLVDTDGNVYVERDPGIFKVDVERPSTLLEVRRYANEIVMDLQAQAAAEYCIATMPRKDPTEPTE